MADSKLGQSKKTIALILGCAVIVIAIFAFAVSQNNGESDSDLDVTYSQEPPKQTSSTPDTSSPTYYYELVEDGMSEGEVDSILKNYEKDVSTEITFEGEHSKTVTYTGDLPDKSFIVITVTFTDGAVSYKTNYTGKYPDATPYDSISTGMTESEVDQSLSSYHKYEESSSGYGGQTVKTVRYTDSGSTFIITYMNGVVSAKAR